MAHLDPLLLRMMENHASDLHIVVGQRPKYRVHGEVTAVEDYPELDERSAAIEGNIAKADEAQKQAEAALEEYTRQLAEARTEAGEIREAAREDGKKIVTEAKETAVAEAGRITAAAHSQIEAERQAAFVSLRSEVGTLAIDLAGGVVGETLSDDARATAVVDRFLADLEKAK